MEARILLREPVIVAVERQRGAAETYGFAGNADWITVEGQLLRLAGVESKTLFVFVHPTSTLQLMPLPVALAKAGLHVLCASSRYAKNDAALIMEKVAIDLGGYIRHAREQLCYDRIVLVGWSGGGSLALFYQAQAETPSITHTPAGDPCDLVDAKLPPADGVIFIAAHLSRAETLTQWLDPSVLDELDPDSRDINLDIYDASCPHAAPFKEEFVEYFRAAQVARNRKITTWAENMLADLRRRNTAEVERAFVTHRTMCDPRWIDLTLEPNGRRINWCYMGDPRAVNVGPVGLARFSTLRSWLSQWSYDLSNAKGAENAVRVLKTPVLQIINQADDAVPASHNSIIRAALGTPDKEIVTIDGATHYYAGQPEQMQTCIRAVLDWSMRKSLYVERSSKRNADAKN
jgi:pimeloyl-ACP methyl ester carboxylesterase